MNELATFFDNLGGEHTPASVIPDGLGLMCEPNCDCEGGYCCEPGGDPDPFPSDQNILASLKSKARTKSRLRKQFDLQQDSKSSSSTVPNKAFSERNLEIVKNMHFIEKTALFHTSCLNKSTFSRE